MKCLFALITILFFFNSQAGAQANKNWDGTKPEIYTGAKSFVFIYSPFVSGELNPAFAGYANLSTDTSLGGTLFNMNFNSLYGVGFKYYVSPKFDLNIGLNVGSASMEEQDGGSGSTNQEVSAFTFGVSLDGNYRLKSLYNISPYIGLNVNFTSVSGELKNISGSTYSDEISGTTFGVGANFGFDWYFTPGMSLGGKYTLGWVGSGGLEETITSSNGTASYDYPKMSNWGTGSASIIMNVHF
jgi:hypothetical protein